MASLKYLGKLYADVENVVFPDGNGDVTTFIDPSSTTATASDVVSGKVFFTSDGTETIGTHTEPTPTLITKSITANGTYDASNDNADGYSEVTVNVSGGGGGGNVPAVVDEDKPVRFYDYDGTLLYSYTPTEFANLSALPANPSHTGLTAQGWNWELAEAKTYVATYGMVDIGQSYITDDGKTRIYITIPAGNAPNRRTMELRLNTVSGNTANCDIDWGDGSNLDSVSITADSSFTHNYSNTGDYVISITVTSGQIRFQHDDTSYRTFGLNNSYRRGWITRVEIGLNVAEIGYYGLATCYNLEYVTIPRTVLTYGNSAFQDSFCGLKFLVLPRAEGNTKYTISQSTFYGDYQLFGVSFSYSIFQILSNAFVNCFALKSLTIPDTVTSIGQYAIDHCYLLERIVIPTSVTSIGTYIGRDSQGLKTLVIGSYEVGSYSFSECLCLESLTLLSGITRINQSSFTNCYSLKSLTIPSTLTTLGSTTFGSIRSVKTLILQEGLKTISQNSLRYPGQLQTLVIPSTVTSISSNALQGCYCLSELHFLRTTPPTLGNSSCFGDMPSDTKIYVPTGSLSAYTSASNYPSSSTYTYIEE